MSHTRSKYGLEWLMLLQVRSTSGHGDRPMPCAATSANSAANQAEAGSFVTRKDLCTNQLQALMYHSTSGSYVTLNFRLKGLASPVSRAITKRRGLWQCTCTLEPASGLYNRPVASGLTGQWPVALVSYWKLTVHILLMQRHLATTRDSNSLGKISLMRIP